jgi:hypothetical protein
MFFDPIVADNQMPQWIADSDTRINGQDRAVPVHVRRIYARIGEFNANLGNGAISFDDFRFCAPIH